MKQLNEKLELLHKLLSGDFDLQEVEKLLLNKYGIQNIDELEKCELHSDDYNTELARIRDILLKEA